MVFFLSKALWYLAEPGNFIVLALTLGVILAWTRWRKLGRRLVAGAAAVLFLIAILPVADWVGGPLESRFRPPAQPTRVAGIIVLGGYINPWISATRHTAALTGAAQRLIETAILARRYPDAKVLVSGGTPILFPDVFSAPPASEAEISERILAQLGVKPDRILLETKSRTTYDNALFSKARAHPRPGQTWILVTSAWHMPRAVGVFRRVGWPVLPWPVDYRSAGTAFPLRGFDLGGHLRNLDLFTHEWIGLIAYRLMGRTSALFPAPQE